VLVRAEFEPLSKIFDEIVDDVVLIQSTPNVAALVGPRSILEERKTELHGRVRT
jgi:hypothetical protein